MAIDTNNITSEFIASATFQRLRSACSAVGVSAKGKTAELRDRLSAHIRNDNCEVCGGNKNTDGECITDPCHDLEPLGLVVQPEPEPEAEPKVDVEPATVKEGKTYTSRTARSLYKSRFGKLPHKSCQDVKALLSAVETGTELPKPEAKRSIDPTSTRQRIIAFCESVIAGEVEALPYGEDDSARPNRATMRRALCEHLAAKRLSIMWLWKKYDETIFPKTPAGALTKGKGKATTASARKKAVDRIRKSLGAFDTADEKVEMLHALIAEIRKDELTDSASAELDAEAAEAEGEATEGAEAAE